MAFAQDGVASLQRGQVEELAVQNSTIAPSAEYEEPDPEELQHAVLAFYLVLVRPARADSWLEPFDQNLKLMIWASRMALAGLKPAARRFRRRTRLQGCVAFQRLSADPGCWRPFLQFVMFGAQWALVSWRKRHRRSYDLATLTGLWLIPPIIAFHLGGLWVKPESVRT
jgi:hypothetical protein